MFYKSNFLKCVGRYMTALRSFILVGIFFCLSACSDSGIEISTTFANTQDIKEGAPVYFNDKVVGQVSDVVSQNNGSRVALELNPEIVSKLGSKSAIVVNRLKEGAPLEIYNRDATDNLPITSGQEIRGLDSMFQLGAWMVGDALQIGAGSISHYVESFQNYLASDEFSQDKENVESQINGATLSAAQAIEAAGQDMSKALKEVIASEDEIVAAVDQLSNELAPVVEKMARSGSQLTVELEKFAAGLESSSEAEQQSGQKLLDSLIAMLEKLNSSIETGATQGVKVDESEQPQKP